MSAAGDTSGRRAKCPVDFDHHSDDFSNNRLERLKEARACPALPYNTNHGGFWMALRYADVAEAQKKAEVFTTRYETELVDGVDFQGLAGIPRNPASTRVGLGEST